MNFYIFAVLSAFLAVSKASNPYYYTPPQLQYYVARPAPSYNPYVNPYVSSTYYVNPHYQQQSYISPHYQQQSYINPHYQQQSYVNHQQNYQTRQQTYQTPEKTYETPETFQETPQTPDYQGFAYHTRNNGATSHVLFVSGPQSQQLRTTIFPNFNLVNLGKTQTEKTTETPQKTTTEYPKNIQEIYTPPGTVPEVTPEAAPLIQHNPERFFREFFQRSEPSVVNFYSRNSNLFAGFPANTFPLNTATATTTTTKTEDLSKERYYSPFINPRFEPETETTTIKLDKVNKTENVAEESIVVSNRFRINQVIQEVEKLTATMTPIVVEEVTSMEPIVVKETTPTPTTTTTETTVTTTTQTPPSTTVEVSTTEITETTESVTSTTSIIEQTDATTEESDLMKSLLILLNQNQSEETTTTDDDAATTTDAAQTTTQLN